MNATLGESINFHPSVTKIGDTGKYLITWNSVLYDQQQENITLADCRSVIKAVIYDSAEDKVVGYKSIVTEDADGQLFTNTVIDTAYDTVNDEVVVLSNIYNGKDSSGEDVIIETVFGSCDVPVIKPDSSKEITFQVDIPNKYFMENDMHLASIVGAIYTGYNPDNTEEQTMITGFTDYVQAEKEPVARTLSLASSKRIGVGQRMVLNTSVAPVEAQVNTEMTYTSSDTSIAEVDENGIITGVKEGECTLTVVTDNGLKKSVNVEVTKEAAAEVDEKQDSGILPDKDKNKKVDTGDHAPILPMAILLVVSLAVIIGIIIIKKKHK